VVIVSPKDMDLIDAYRPCIVQQYFNHSEILFKVYVIDEEVMFFKRKSLPDLDYAAALRSVAFDSRLSYPTLSDFLLKPEDFCCRSANNSSLNNNNSHGIGNGKIAEGDNISINGCTPDRSVATFFINALLNALFSTLGEENDSWKLSCSRPYSPKNGAVALEGVLPIEAEKCYLRKGSDVSPYYKGKVLCFPLLPSIENSGCRSLELFTRAAGAIKADFGLSLFGFDVILPVSSLDAPRLAVPPHLLGPSPPPSELCPKPMVIDVNYFPSYKEVADFPSKLRWFLRRKASSSSSSSSFLSPSCVS
jgi:hypothetical protein